MQTEFRAGLEGVVAAQTRLSLVDGEAGILLIAGVPVDELATQARFEEVVELLWNAALPEGESIVNVEKKLVGFRPLHAITRSVLKDAAGRRVPPMDALRMAAGTLSLAAGSETEPQSAQEEAMLMVASMPTIVASYWRMLSGLDAIAPREDLGHAANFLYMLDGEIPTPSRRDALEAYLNTVIDHGLNASTFTARVIVSTGSDIISSVVGAIGALKGPLHGGAPGPALDMVFEIGTADCAEGYLRGKLERGERLMGFGHRIYKVRDPRADVLAGVAEHLYREGDIAFYRLAHHVEATAVRLLEEYKPGRNLQTNVEFYTALTLHGIGIEVHLFTAIFAMARVAGWTAHSLEQRRVGRIFRPQSEYIGSPMRSLSSAIATTSA